MNRCRAILTIACLSACGGIQHREPNPEADGCIDVAKVPEIEWQLDPETIIYPIGSKFLNVYIEGSDRKFFVCGFEHDYFGPCQATNDTIWCPAGKQRRPWSSIYAVERWLDAFSDAHGLPPKRHHHNISPPIFRTDSM